MNTLQDCLKIYLKLMKNDYYITLENNVKIKVYFDKKNFYHLLGLHKLRDITILRNSPNVVFKNIVNGKITHNHITKSVHFNKVENRFKYFHYLPIMLSKDSKVIVDFNYRLMNKTKLKETRYILFRCINDEGVVHFTLGKRDGDVYPETFFFDDTNKYIEKQKLLKIRDIQTIKRKK